MHAVLEEPAADRLVRLLQAYAGEAVDPRRAGEAVVTLAVGIERGLVRSAVAQRLALVVPAEPDRAQEYAGEVLDLQGELERNPRGPSEEFEQVLRPVFQRMRRPWSRSARSWAAWRA